MMNKSTFTALSAALLLTTTSFPAHAIKMVSGGVGESSKEMIERVEERYNLKVIFTGEGGMYLSDVLVSIKDKDGKELATGTTSGPILLAQLEPGKYTLHTSKDGVDKKRNIRLDDDLRTYHITFPVKDEPAAKPNVVKPMAVQKHLDDTHTVGKRLENME